MDNIAKASINSFGISPKADFVPHSEEAVFVLTSSQLLDLITRAVEKALQPLQDRVSEMEDKIDRLQEDNAAMHLKLASLETTQDTLSTNQLIQLRLIREVKEDAHKDTGPSQGELERVARIEKLCQDAPGHIISLPELRGRLGIDKAVLSRLLKRINQDKFYLRQNKTDKRIRYLCLRPEVR